MATVRVGDHDLGKSEAPAGSRRNPSYKTQVRKSAGASSRHRLRPIKVGTEMGACNSTTDYQAQHVCRL